MTKSASSKIKEFITSNDANPAGFTAPELAKLVDITDGAASGMLSRMLKHDIATKVGIRDGRTVYMVDPVLAADMRVHGSPSHGSYKGKKGHGGHSRQGLTDMSDLVAPEPYDVISALMEAAGWLEAHKPTLDDFTTSELVNELKRRLAP